MAELLELDRAVIEAFLAGEDAGSLTRRVRAGQSLYDEALELVRRGLTTEAEIERVFGTGVVAV